MSDCRHAGTDVPTRELNPSSCPFCGGESVIVWQVETDKNHGECLKCGARTKEYDTELEAERAWNTRYAEITIKGEQWEELKREIVKKYGDEIRAFMEVDGCDHS